MILTLDVPRDAAHCADSLWRVEIAADALTAQLQLEVGKAYRWQELISKAAALGFPVGHPVLAFCYALRELSAVADLQRGGEGAPRVVVS